MIMMLRFDSDLTRLTFINIFIYIYYFVNSLNFIESSNKYGPSSLMIGVLQYSGLTHESIGDN